MRQVGLVIAIAFGVSLCVAIGAVMVTSMIDAINAVVPETPDTHTFTRTPDPPDSLFFAMMWEEVYEPGRCLMNLVVPHGDSTPQEYMVLTVGFNRRDGTPLGFAFNVPNTADRDMGMAMGFVDTGTSDTGKFEYEIVEGGTRILPFDDCEGEGCIAWLLVDGGSGSIDDQDVMDLLDDFLTRDSILFYYWVDGERIRSSTTLAGFQAQYPEMIKNLKRPNLAGLE